MLNPLYLRIKLINPVQTIDLLFLIICFADGAGELFAQNLKIFNKFIIFPFILLNKSIFGHSRHLILLTQFDKSNLLTKSPNNLSFCNEDLEIGNNFFKKVFKENINQKFVLLIIRDPAYLNSLFNKNWSYHDSRNINLHNIVEACSVLTSLGYYIFRMGSLVEEKINSSDPKIIDYATNGMRTDFLDVFLSANCSFAVSSGTGLDLVPMLFRKPVLTLSYVQIGQFHLSKTMNYSMISFRNFYSSILRRNLDLTEIFKLGLQKIDADLLVKNSIILKESSVEENKKIILEMTNFVENKKFDFISNNNLAFRKNMNELYKSFNSSNALEENFNIKISDVFLNNNKNFLR